MSIHQIKANLRDIDRDKDRGKDKIPIKFEPDSDEEEEPVPWTLDSLKGDYDPNNIVATLTDEEHYTYNTKKSASEFHKMFKLMCDSMEEEYLNEN
jgi:hypothetical protein